MTTVTIEFNGTRFVVDPKLDRITIIPVVGNAITLRKREWDQVAQELRKAPCNHFAGDCGGKCASCRKSKHTQTVNKSRKPRDGGGPK